jgi:hypothetical protein
MKRGHERVFDREVELRKKAVIRCGVFSLTKVLENETDSCTLTILGVFLTDFLYEAGVLDSGKGNKPNRRVVSLAMCRDRNNLQVLAREKDTVIVLMTQVESLGSCVIPKARV